MTAGPILNRPRLETTRGFVWLMILFLPVAFAWTQFHALLDLALADERYSHTLLIPVISGCLLFLRRKSVLAGRGRFSSWKFFAALLGIVIVLLSLERGNLRLSILTVVLYWITSFILGYGIQSAKKVAFPLAFLFLMVPLPVSLMDSTVVILQRGSANAAYALFKVAGVPVYRQGFQFSLPGVDIKVAEECSGIRSCIALFITSLLAAHLFLRSNWNKLFVGLVAIPIAIFKNAVRIFTISWLGVYVDSGFLYGRLHRYGGLPFSIFALALLLPLLFVFYKWEARQASPEHNSLR
jgi:exosortase